MTEEENADDDTSSPYTMTEEILRKRLQKEDRGRYGTQFCAAIVASVSAISFGTCLGWSNSALQHVSRVYLANSTEEMHSWVASMMPLGNTIGIVPWAYCNKKFGPKRTMLLQSPFYILTWVLIASVKRINIYIAGRFFTGFLAASYYVCGETLLVDTVHRGNLRHMLVFYRSSTLLGVLISYLMGFAINKSLSTIVCALIAVVHTGLLAIIPESPVFLYSINAIQAEESLAWYRGRQNAHSEMRKIRQDAELRTVDPAATSAMIYSKVVIKGILIVLGLGFFQICSGYYVFMFYSTEIWHNRDEQFDPLIESAIYGCFMFVLNAISMIVNGQLDLSMRKPLLVSSGLVTLQTVLISIFVYIQDYGNTLFTKLRWAPVTLVVMLVLFYEMALSTYGDVLLYHYMPYQVYRRAKDVVSFAYWLFVFLLVKYFITIKVATYDYVPHVILSGLSGIGFFYIYFVVVETKNKSLVQIQCEIGGNPIGNRGFYRQRVNI